MYHNTNKDSNLTGACKLTTPTPGESGLLLICNGNYDITYQTDTNVPEISETISMHFPDLQLKGLNLD